MAQFPKPGTNVLIETVGVYQVEWGCSQAHQYSLVKKKINQKNPATLAQFIEINWAKMTVPFETYK